MKNYFPAILLALITLSCKKNKTKTEDTANTTCMQITDANTHEPIQSVNATFNTGSGGYYYGGGQGFSTYSDANGSICYDKNKAYSSLIIYRSEYIDKKFNAPFPAKTELQAFAWIKVHIKNIPPASTEDYFTLYNRPELGIAPLPDPMGNYGISWRGKMDTTVTFQVDPAVGYFQWSLNANSSSGMTTYSATGHQTVTIADIEY